MSRCQFEKCKHCHDNLLVFPFTNNNFTKWRKIKFTFKRKFQLTFPYFLATVKGGLPLNTRVISNLRIKIPRQDAPVAAMFSSCLSHSLPLVNFITHNTHCTLIIIIILLLRKNEPASEIFFTYHLFQQCLRVIHEGRSAAFERLPPARADDTFRRIRRETIWGLSAPPNSPKKKTSFTVWIMRVEGIITHIHISSWEHSQRWANRE